MAKKKRAEVAKSNVVLGRLEVVYLPVNDIHPNDYNPNRQSEHDFELLCRSIEDDGFTQPVVVHRETKTIVDGEHRWRACMALGHEEVPVVLVDMSPEQMRIATLRHNRARGSEDARLAGDVVRELVEMGATDWAQDALLLDDVELSRLTEDLKSEQTASMMADQPMEALGPAGGGLSALDQRTNPDLAADQQRAKERLLQAAKGQEERAMAAGDADYRLVLNFSDREAVVIRQVLGKEPAQRLLELCRANPAGN